MRQRGTEDAFIDFITNEKSVQHYRVQCVSRRPRNSILFYQRSEQWPMTGYFRFTSLNKFCYKTFSETTHFCANADFLCEIFVVLGTSC